MTPAFWPGSYWPALARVLCQRHWRLVPGAVETELCDAVKGYLLRQSASSESGLRTAVDLAIASVTVQAGGL